MKSCSMSRIKKSRFKHFLKHKVLPDIIKQTKDWVTDTTIQFDATGGHGKSVEMIAVLNLWVSKNPDSLQTAHGIPKKNKL